MDPTLRHVNVWRSIKKIFIDGLPNKEIFFDEIVAVPQEVSGNTWVCIMTKNLVPDQVSTGTLTVFMFSKSDMEGDELVALRDDVMGVLEPGFIDLYDTSKDPWVKIGGIKVIPTFQSAKTKLANRVNEMHIENTLKWGAVW